jgi:hypothetical protein
MTRIQFSAGKTPSSSPSHPTLLAVTAMSHLSQNLITLTCSPSCELAILLTGVSAI